ncbi:hypothetical protein QQF64_006404 [Cirrhinus molitorella]|uniref:Uncharacterized protein n=1 Tax=Cirrhinus molitorella TaxID=172907 RepID=A0ABR3MGD5_9TELE
MFFATSAKPIWPKVSPDILKGLKFSPPHVEDTALLSERKRVLSDGELRLEERAGHPEFKNSPETHGTPVGLLKAVYMSPCERGIH